MVRKGIKAGLKGEVDEGVDRFFAAYAQSVHRLGTPVFSKRYFQILREVFGPDCEVLPYYGGGTEQARDVAGNDFMYWDLMRRACERGIRIFDYGRSKRGTGSFDFKKNWGFEPQALNYEYRLVKGKRVPELNPLNPKYRLLIKVWQRLPLALANRIGPHIARSLG